MHRRGTLDRDDWGRLATVARWVEALADIAVLALGRLEQRLQLRHERGRVGTQGIERGEHQLGAEGLVRLGQTWRSCRAAQLLGTL